jgi:hypothetical protein
MFNGLPHWAPALGSRIGLPHWAPALGSRIGLPHSTLWNGLLHWAPAFHIVELDPALGSRIPQCGMREPMLNWLNVIMLNVIMLIVIMLNVIMLNVNV